jgi:hypothetical protein
VLWSRGRSVAPTTTGSALESADQWAASVLLIRRGEAALRFDHRPASGSALGRGSDADNIYLSSIAYPGDVDRLAATNGVVKRLSKTYCQCWIEWIDSGVMQPIG